MKTKQLILDRPAEIAKVRALWETLMQLLPRLHASMPAVAARAQDKLMAHNPSVAPEFGKVLLFSFYRLSMLLTERGEPLTMREVSEFLDVPLSSATRLVDTLVENGFVVRRADPQDRRVVRIALTAEGETFYAACVEFFDTRIAEFLTHFDAREIAQMLALFEKTVAVLRHMDLDVDNAS